LNSILQIVPRVPGEIDGVGDYALTIARKLRDKFGFDSAFAAPGVSAPTTVCGFGVLPWSQVIAAGPKYGGVVLHYVNYGFQKRGIPFGLLTVLRRMRPQIHGKFVTIFHEFYASGPPWRSEFWLRPFQIHLGKAIAGLSDECIVSSPIFVHELGRVAPAARVHLHPVPSELGEPTLSNGQIENRDPHQWVIVGSAIPAQRSLRSFRENLRRIPSSVSPKKLIVIGGHESAVTRALLADLGIESEYRPQIAAAEASAILSSCSFAWFNYFTRPDVETSVLLKSSAFAAACAHGTIPVLAHHGPPISIDGDPLPGPFFVESNCSDVPTPEDRSKVAANIYNWYQRHASSDCLVGEIARLIECGSGIGRSAVRSELAT
jgi:hypothetical protein